MTEPEPDPLPVEMQLHISVTRAMAVTIAVAIREARTGVMGSDDTEKTCRRYATLFDELLTE